MDIAWIGVAGAVGAAYVTGRAGMRQAVLERRLQADDVLTRYRQPLAVAAFELQSRIYNVLELGFVETFGEDHARREEAARTTLFRFAQYFGWSEILRRDIQFLDFEQQGDARRVARLQSAIAEDLLDSKLGETMMIWRDEQRAIGELMIVEEHGKVICMGYARFSACCATTFAPWLERLWREIAQPEARERLRALQHDLCSLVEALDGRGLTHPGPLRRAGG